MAATLPLQAPARRPSGADASRTPSPSAFWLAMRAAQAPDVHALSCEGARTLTYAELARQVSARAATFASLAGQGEARVALLGKTSPDYALWLLAALVAGVQAVTLNARLSPAELAGQLADCRPAAVLCDDASRDAAREALRLARGAAGPLPDEDGAQDCAANPVGLVTFAGLNARHGLAHASELGSALPRDGAGSAGDADAAGNLPCKHPTPADLARVATIMYTSGTTGRPKGVLQTFANHLRSAENCRANLGFTVCDTWGCAVPLFHTSGLSILMRSLACGVGVRLYRRFDASVLNNDLLSGRITCLSAVTYQVDRLLDDLEARPASQRRYPSSLRFVLQGGGPLPLRTIERCAAAGMPVVQSFGMTETASQVVSLSPADASRKPGSAGRVLPGVQLRIAPLGDPADTPVPVGETGRVLLKSPTLAAGYLNQEARWAERFSADGWFDTGDLGHVDDEGYLYLACRRDDLIISGGENVYPGEVERVLAQHPLVGQAVVVGVDDPVWGTVPAAVCVPTGGASPDDPSLPDGDALNAFCRARLAPYKCPRHAVWVAELPRTATGKLSRTALRALVE